MSFVPLATPRFGNDQDFDAWRLSHGVAHETIYTSVLSVGAVLDHFPQFEIGAKDTLLTHYIEHQRIHSFLGLADLPDLSDVDFEDEGQFSDWHFLHAAAHEQIELSLGLT